MKILGIIAEYNPFHNGHLYHLKEAQKINPDITIAVITSTFNSRGELSLLTTKEKTEILLNNNVDIIVELPFIHATQSADIFAYKAVEILNNFKVTNIISGSENDNLNYIKELTEITQKESYNKNLKNGLDKGLSYKQASNNALNLEGIKEPMSNDMLNWKYYEAIQKINKNIELSFIKRLNSNYLDKTQNDTNICSATSIRETKNYKGYVPNEVSEILDKKQPLNEEKLHDYFKLLRLTNSFKNINMLDEGMDNLFKNSTSSTYKELIDSLTSKRYTNSRIRRSLLQIIFNITKEDSINSFKENTNPRVLGFNEKGQNYLNSIKKDTSFFTKLRSNESTTYDIEIKINKVLDQLYNTTNLKEIKHLPIIKK